MYMLSNWTVIERTGHSGDSVMRLRGDVSGHERYPPGATVTISALRSCSREGNSVVVMTHSGTEYMLGTPTEADATERVLAYLRAKSEAITVSHG
jgi:hypothetical protein